MQSIRHSLRDEVCERVCEYIIMLMIENVRAGFYVGNLHAFHSVFIIELQSAEAHS